METFLSFFSVNTVMFQFWSYPMSYIEFVGTVFNLWCVWLAARNKILSWPVGIVGVVLYIFLFYQIQLYSDLFEQIYFLITGFWGWYLWSNLRKRKKNEEKILPITKNSSKANIIYVIAIVVATLLLTYFMSHIHEYFPKLFPEPASYPFLDAFTTVMSFLAQALMAKRRLECWFLWIVVDIIGIGLYFVKDVKFISLEYVIFLGLATKGMFDWMKDYKLKHKKA